MKYRIDRGFSVLELLVAIAVVAVLAALLFSPVRQMIHRSRTTECASNLRNWHVLFALYATEHDQRIPSIYLDASQTQSGVSEYWFSAFDEEYISEPERIRIGTCGNADDYVPGAVATSYGMNAQLLPSESWRLSCIVEPSRTILLGDVGINAAWHSGATSIKSHSESNDPARTPCYREQGEKCNILFFDGHVESMIEPDIHSELFDLSK